VNEKAKLALSVKPQSCAHLALLEPEVTHDAYYFIFPARRSVAAAVQRPQKQDPAAANFRDVLRKLDQNKTTRIVVSLSLPDIAEIETKLLVLTGESQTTNVKKLTGALR
jgi:hypothetical protein